MFEYTNYDEKGANIAIPKEIIAKKSGIVMYYNNKSVFPENFESGRYISFYETKSVKENMWDITYNGGIVLRGGDRELLTGGNNVIANNYIYNAGNKQRCTPL